jgi:predicted lipid-binding transport protein (Tim44 family)
MTIGILVTISFCALATVCFFGWRWYCSRQAEGRAVQIESHKQTYVGLQGWVVAPVTTVGDTTVGGLPSVMSPDYSPNDTQPIHDPASLMVIQNAKQVFMRLIAAWDNANIKELNSLLTPEAYQQLVDETTLAPRPDAPTDILTLNAELITGGAASQNSVDVRFSGMYRTALSSAARRFDAVWALQRSDSNWQVSHIQPI